MNEGSSLLASCLRNDPALLLLKQSHPFLGQLLILTGKIPLHSLHLSLSILASMPYLDLRSIIGILECRHPDGCGDVILGIGQLRSKGKVLVVIVVEEYPADVVVDKKTVVAEY
jgi:hypothetical protein